MTFRTVYLNGGIKEIDFNADGKSPYFYNSEKYAWVKNDSETALYISAVSDVQPDAAGTIPIAPAESARIEIDYTNKIYLLGQGKAELSTFAVPVCPFDSNSGDGSSGGGGETIKYAPVIRILQIADNNAVEVDFDPDGSDSDFYLKRGYVWVRNIAGGSLLVSHSNTDNWDPISNNDVIFMLKDDAHLVQLDSTNKLYLKGSCLVELYASSSEICPYIKLSL